MALANALLQYGIRADQPAAAAENNGIYYRVTDEGDIVEQSDGATWTPINAGASAGLVLLETQTASSSASLVFTSSITSAHDAYWLEFINLIPATNGVALRMRMSTDGGATYDTSGIYSYESFAWRAAGSSAQGATAQTSIFLSDAADISNSATWGVSGYVQLFNPLSASLYKRVRGALTYFNSTSSSRFNVETAGAYESATAVDAFEISTSSGPLASGIVRCYGWKR